jgi:hypothetical protein
MVTVIHITALLSDVVKLRHVFKTEQVSLLWRPTQPTMDGGSWHLLSSPPLLHWMLADLFLKLWKTFVLKH